MLAPRSTRRPLRSTAASFAGGLLVVAGCDGGEPAPSTNSAPAAPAVAVPSDPFADLRTRTGLGFARADFLKPVMDAAPAGTALDPYLAPLIYREVRDGDEPARGGKRFGALVLDPAGEAGVDPEQPTVYFERTRVELAGSEHARLAFLWFREGDAGLVVQGLRVTLGADGRPLAFEVLQDASGACLLYATETLEEVVALDAGAPLPGRAFAIEADAAAYPDVVVARVVPAGPVPLGPFVYENAGAGDLGSLHCRCQASQVGAQRELVEYALVPLDAVPGAAARVPPWPADERGGLSACLRWPPGL